MTDSTNQTQIKSLDGSVHTIADEPSTATQAQTETSLPIRSKIEQSLPTKDPVLPPGQTLTGKQEHCMAFPAFAWGRQE